VSDDATAKHVRTLLMASSCPLRCRLALVIGALLGMGCATPSRDRAWIADELGRRTGYRLRTAEDEGKALPPGVRVEDGLNEDETVALALWNSPAFAADLERLSTATADFRQASRIDNPVVNVGMPVGNIVSQVSLVAPLMSLLTLSQRIEDADRTVSSVAESLVQSGLDLIRDVRLAHVERALAERRLEIQRELEANAKQLAELADSRATAGEISPAEALAVRADAAIAADTAQLAERDLAIANGKLQALLGGPVGSALTVVLARPLPQTAPGLNDLLQVARQSRPDVLAIEQELEGAAARAGWERWRILALSAQGTAQWNSQKVGARVGGSVALPIFNQNQGGVGRAEAAIASAQHRIEALRQQVTLEVLTAQAQLEQAIASLQRYEGTIVPPLEDALKAATERYELGDDSYLIVLDALRRLGNARLRAAELDAEVRRAQAQLERAVGARLEITTGPRKDSP